MCQARNGIEVIHLPEISDNKPLLIIGSTKIIEIKNVEKLYSQCSSLLKKIKQGNLKVFRVFFANAEGLDKTRMDCEVDIAAAEIPRTADRVRQLAIALHNKQMGYKEVEFLDKDCEILGSTTFLHKVKLQIPVSGATESVYEVESQNVLPSFMTLTRLLHDAAKQFPAEPSPSGLSTSHATTFSSKQQHKQGALNKTEPQLHTSASSLTLTSE